MTWWVLWVGWVCLFLLSSPRTDFIVHGVHGPIDFTIALPSWFFALLQFVLGIAFACGMASTFNLDPAVEVVVRAGFSRH